MTDEKRVCPAITGHDQAVIKVLESLIENIKRGDWHDVVYKAESFLDIGINVPGIRMTMYFHGAPSHFPDHDELKKLRALHKEQEKA